MGIKKSSIKKIKDRTQLLSPYVLSLPPIRPRRRFELVTLAGLLTPGSISPRPSQSCDQWYSRFVPSYSGGTVSGFHGVSFSVARHLATTRVLKLPSKELNGFYLTPAVIANVELQTDLDKAL